MLREPHEYLYRGRQEFFDRKPLTRVRLTKAGCKALAAYVTAMAQLVEDE